MSWFRRSPAEAAARKEARAAEAAAHPVPVELDLGMRRVNDVDMVIMSLRAEGCEVRLVDQGQVGFRLGTMTAKPCVVLVRPADADRAREAFTAAHLL